MYEFMENGSLKDHLHCTLLRFFYFLEISHFKKLDTILFEYLGAMIMILFSYL